MTHSLADSHPIRKRKGLNVRRGCIIMIYTNRYAHSEGNLGEKMVVDIHTPVFPDRIAAAAVQKLQEASRTVAYSDGTASGIRGSMVRAGVEWSVVLPVATNPAKVGSVNDLSIRQTGRDGLIYFGCAHPDAPGMRAELGRIAAAGLKGVKLHPVYQGADIDDLRFLRILDRAGELGLAVITHAGDDIGYPGEVRCSPEMIVRALKQVGPVKFVAAHMGGWRNWDRAAELLPELGVYIDTAFYLGRIAPLRADAFAPEELEMLSGEAFVRLVRRFGTDRVLFGSDSPWSDQAESLAQLRGLPLEPGELEDILGRNARRLLDIQGMPERTEVKGEQ